MDKELLSGNEAVARGAYEAGVRVAAAYPGTPSTEILENLAKYDAVYSEWSPNEKVALDVAIGATYAGSRAMVVMKHVGLNVAADAFFYASMTGMEAGLVLVCADDPNMYSSQNEQDNRNYAKFARVPCLEPSDSQEAKDMVGMALDMSEQFDGPVMLRLTTRISHSDTLVEPGTRAALELAEPPEYRIDCTKYVMVPGNARRRHPVIEERIKKAKEFAETFSYNRVEMGDTSLGIVTGGVAYQYAREVFPDASILKLGMTYPLPEQMIRDFAARVDRLVVVEELDPFIENAIKLMGIGVEGKSIFPICGELDPTIVRKCAAEAGLIAADSPSPSPSPTGRGECLSPQRRGSEGGAVKLPARPPLLCPGCPHRGLFVVINKLKLVVNGDIGCYTLGFLPPLSALHTCGCMGASIGVAHGVSKAGIAQKHVAVIGDSTFFHTGMPALLNVAYNQSDTVVIIVDNRTTAMTGHQQHPGTGATLMGESTYAVEFADLAHAMGIQRVHTVDSYDLKAVEAALRDCLDNAGPAVVVSRRECALLPVARRQWMALAVNEERCNGCGLCFQVGCPAIVKSDALDEKTNRAKAWIDPFLCTGCEVCAQVCARKAILFRSEMAQV
ncbi:MAG: indolepyruvate ferredoxin oxidoreductase subunit alpha [Anaerolineae bacterium]|nr:indolepyruvate ferredoxin oxidoreductase subunit alpha [Anaerolineae bacterium]